MTIRTAKLAAVLAMLCASSAKAVILDHKTFMLPNAGAGGTGTGTGSPSNNYDMIYSQHVGEGWGFIGGAGAVQGSGSTTNTAGHPVASNESLKFDIGSTIDSLNTAYGIGGWSISNLQLQFVSSNTVQGNSRFGLGSGDYQTYWVANDGWQESAGTTTDRQLNPIYANDTTTLNAWAGSSSLVDSATFTVAGSGAVTITRPLSATTDFVNDITSASSASNQYLSLYMLAPSSTSTLGMLIFTGGQSQATPSLSFDVVSVPEPSAFGLLIVAGLLRRRPSIK